MSSFGFEKDEWTFFIDRIDLKLQNLTKNVKL